MLLHKHQINDHNFNHPLIFYTINLLNYEFRLLIDNVFSSNFIFKPYGWIYYGNNYNYSWQHELGDECWNNISGFITASLLSNKFIPFKVDF